MQCFHTGRYDLATDKFIGGQIATLVEAPATKVWPLKRQILLKADTLSDLCRLHEEHTNGKATPQA
jgi:ribosomal protein S3AE